MLDFHRLYAPLTFLPFTDHAGYKEYAPSEALRPYVACYWTMEGLSQDRLIIPDTCIDLIIQVNHTRQTIGGRLCTIQDRPLWTVKRVSPDVITNIAVRFYFWSAHLFLPFSFKNTGNQVLELAEAGREWEKLMEGFLIKITMKERIEQIEALITQKLSAAELDSNLFNCIYQMLHTRGRASVSEICEYASVSQRQMERLFAQKVGLTLKRTSSLVRYQNVWRDIVLSPDFCVQDAVCRCGFTDQSHLLREFKRFHGMTIKEAKRTRFGK